jgi:hypothetical protein
VGGHASSCACSISKCSTMCLMADEGVSERTPGQRHRLMLHIIHAALPNTHF